ncbi:erythrocyte membrane protein 1, EMP1 [Plasmodium reichenowi]|uniref:Erythrocyte membrane protein 1, EMP1 n=1 Tax=Plasmodium reichenowi TaxID=5854 RepID=A0A060RP46_PLARE|nr:erythrocyte membrane protein 1, EMP1 [Plasmodium reichenowi]
MAAAQGRGGGGKDKYDDAKDFLDQIGQQVHNKVEEEAKTYKDELKGDLKNAANTSIDLVSSNDTCHLVEQYYTKRLNGDDNRHPCGNVIGNGGTAKDDLKRFSKESGAECANNRIEGNIKNSKNKDFGACAPYRRLSLCNKNFQNMNIKDSSGKAKDNLLADVCMAAYYEGQSIKTHYPQYDAEYPVSGSNFTMCTMLARSFADIGDIIRGKDLYRGGGNKKRNQTERDKLEEKLKGVFGKIYGNLEKKDRYNGDKENFYQLREDWWTANRHTVWEAMTCNEDLKNSSYFRATCSDGKNQYQAHEKCRCEKKRGANADQVPTYFDYVPQYLRWFEEWAEDFCRKRKKKLENLDKQCRGEYEREKRYCSRNGYDCEETVRARGKLRMGKGCISCLYACNPYIDWINNQKEQFLKQRNKYQDEISGGSGGGRRKKQAASTSNYERYEKKFYDELKNNSEFGTVDGFLDLLNKEKTCQKNAEIKEEGEINFKTVNSGSGGGNDVVASGVGGTGTSADMNSNKTFYRTKYCQVCPHCGVEKENNGKGWKEKSADDKCTRKNLYRPKSVEVGTTINFLYSGDGEKEIKEKLNKFCAEKKSGNSVPSGSSERGSDKNGFSGGNSDSKELYQDWKCYQMGELEKVVQYDEEEDDVQSGGGLCILQNDPKKKEEKEKKKESENKSADLPGEFQKTFNDFFNFWVAHMLKDSIHWRTEKIKKCLNNKSKKCGNQQCTDDCNCYEKWVEQKEKEWKNIKKHFNTQDIGQQEEMLGKLSHDELLEQVLNKEVLLTSIKEGYGNEEDIIHIKELFQETGVDGTSGLSAPNGQNTTIDKLLQREGDEADKCKETQEHCQRKKFKNPCTGNTSGGTYRAMAESVAEILGGQAKGQLDGNGGGESALKGHIENAKFKNGVSWSQLTNVCGLTKDHTNDSRRDGNKYDGPCGGKGKRFKIEEVWKTGPEESTMPGVYIPPRRRHMWVVVRVRKGHIENAKFKNGVSWSQLTNVCGLTKDHTNDSRRDGNKYDGPCGGKGKRFKIEEVWKTGPEESTMPGVYIPPRRRHMCTSNVEYLVRPHWGPLLELGKENFNHSFLGDVLLAAKSEAEYIKNNMDTNKNEDKCRAIRYSFADIGDIIRGKDLWDKNKDANELQGHLQKIFKQIKDKDPEIKAKYAHENDNKKYLELRSDWWEANRDQVWKAMTCHMEGLKDKSSQGTRSSHCGYDNTTPLDDYIPQRLRWMTEWAEWYCEKKKNIIQYKNYL